MERQPLVLIVDDDEAVVAMLRNRLLRGEFRVASCDNGQNGLEIARSRRPDLILLDQCMPAMNGFDVMEQLRRHPETQHIPVAMISGAGIEPWQALSCGAAALLPKPFQKDELLELIESLLVAPFDTNSDGSCHAGTMY